MKRIRPIKILLLAAIATTGLSALGHALLVDEQPRFGADDALEKLAAHRFKDARGLSPCEPEMQDILRSSRYKLLTLGEPSPQLMVVIAPTFSGAEVVAFNKGNIKTFRFPGQSGFMPPSDWLSATPQLVSTIQLSPTEYNSVFAPISRHIRYAMTARDLGLDGVNYYFANGEDECAFTWSPRGQGPAALISNLINEASSKTPSRGKLLALAEDINRADRSH